MYVGCVAQLVDHFERRSLLTLDPVRVDRIDERDRVMGEPGRVPSSRRSSRRSAPLGTMHDCLSELAGRDPASRQQHDCGKARPGRVRRGRRRGVAGRGATTACAPCPAATLSATVMPRSLNEPVGLVPSILIQVSQCRISDSFSAATSGVPPSPRVITGSLSDTGSQSR